MKIAVLGYVGSGKTYLSDCISEKKNIPVLHIDSIKWNKEWKALDDSFVLPQVSAFMEKEDWIIDGNYASLMLEERIRWADKIIILLLPRLMCFFRAVKRAKIREKEGYKNDLNWWFIKFALFGCRNKKRLKLYADIAERYGDKTVVLKTKKQVDEYIENF